MASGLDRILSGSPYGFGEGKNAEDLDPDALRQALLVIARGAVAEPVSGVVGLGSLPWGIDKAVSNMDATRDAIGYQPSKTDHLDYIAKIAEPITDWAKENIGDLREKAGSWTLDKTGSPGLATAAHSLPEIIALGLSGGAMVPAVRAVSKATPDGVVDPSRRRALGLMGGGAAVAGAMALAPKMAMKSIIDVPTGASAKAGATAVSAAAKAIPRAVVSSHTLRMINMLKTYPMLKAAFKKGGHQGFKNKVSETDNLINQIDKDMDALGQSQGMSLEYMNKPEFNDLSIKMHKLRDDSPAIDNYNDYKEVNWDDVSKNLDNDRLETSSKGYDYDIESVNMTDIAPRYFKENKNAVDINEYMVGSGELFSEADFKKYLKGRSKDTPETKNIIDDMLKDPKAYDNYINTYDKQLNEYGGEYSF